MEAFCDEMCLVKSSKLNFIVKIHLHPTILDAISRDTSCHVIIFVFCIVFFKHFLLPIWVFHGLSCHSRNELSVNNSRNWRDLSDPVWDRVIILCCWVIGAVDCSLVAWDECLPHGRRSTGDVIGGDDSTCGDIVLVIEVTSTTSGCRVITGSEGSTGGAIEWIVDVDLWEVDTKTT